jgi:hypothetical protein
MFIYSLLRKYARGAHALGDHPRVAGLKVLRVEMESLIGDMEFITRELGTIKTNKSML